MAKLTIRYFELELGIVDGRIERCSIRTELPQAPGTIAKVLGVPLPPLPPRPRRKRKAVRR